MTTNETGDSLITAFSLAEKFHAGQNRKSAADAEGGSGVKEKPVPYISYLLAPDHNRDAILVALADKTHNGEATLRDWDASGHDPQMFAKFHRGYDEQKQ